MPLGIDRLRASLPAGTAAWCHARFRQREDRERELATADLALLDAAGKPVLEIEGLRLKRAERLTLLGDNAGKSVEHCFYGREWVECPAANRAARQARAERPGTWLILADTGGVGRALSRLLERRGHACVLDALGPLAGNLEALLCRDESNQAASFPTPQQRRRFPVRRALLRIVLGRHLCLPPQELRFTRAHHGKPHLDSRRHATGLRFSVSSSERYALLGITRRREIGVDLEQIDPNVNPLEVARRFFSPREVRALERLPPALRLERFFTCWTRKEAYLKATGEGLSGALRQADVSGTQQRSNAVSLENQTSSVHAAGLRVQDDPGNPARWSLLDVAVGQGYRGAIAVEGQAWQLRDGPSERRCG